MKTSEASPNPAAVTPRKYFAFISYSHRDSEIVRRLHRGLEQYYLPTRLVGQPSPKVDTIPRRLYPIFLDRDELPSAATLKSPIEEALNHSSTLIVVCSAHSATSRWVNSEVEHFKRTGRTDRVICIIVDGEPNGSDKLELGKPECFCPALRFVLDSEGRLTTQREEPLAADLREGGDGWKRAKLKLVAAMLGIPFDELNQRERERIRKRRVWQAVAIGFTLLATLTGGRSVYEHYKRSESAIYLKNAKAALAERHYLAAALHAEAAASVRTNTPGLREIMPELNKAFPEPVALLEAKAQRMEHLIFSHDARTIYAAGGDGKLYRWRLDSPNAEPLTIAIGAKMRSLARLALPKSDGPLLIAAWDASEVR